MRYRFNGALKGGADPADLAQLLASYGVQAVEDTARLTPAERVTLYHELARREQVAKARQAYVRATVRRKARYRRARRMREAAHHDG
jgi:hypothetical protein